MNNQEVINAFVCGRSGRSSNGNLYSNGNKLINYYTCIAERLADGTILFNGTKYSVSTSKIQTWTKRTLTLEGIRYKEVTKIPLGAWGLERYL